MDGSTFLRAAAVQVGQVAAVSLALALALPESFFEDWGWLSGPLAWMGCAALTARILDLPLGSALVGAALAGIPSLAAVLIGLHWLGVLLAVALFAAWCARRPREAAWT